MSFLTLKYHYKVKNNKELTLLKFLTHISKNLYNATLYQMRKDFFETGYIKSYFEYNKIMNNNENFHLLNTYQSICTIRSCYYMMENFVKYHNVNDKVKLPHYLNKYGCYPLYTDQVRVLVNNNHQYIKLPLSNILRTNQIYNKTYDDSLINRFISELNNQHIDAIYFRVPRVLYSKHIKQIRIVPSKNNNFYLEFSYINEELSNVDLDDNLYGGIDVGLNNLATIGLSTGESIIIDGRKLKSFNQFYSKKKARLQSLLPKNIKYSKSLKKLDNHHYHLVEDYINKAVNQTLEILKNKKVKHVVIGYNKGFKSNGINNDALTKKQKRQINQLYCSIPLSRFINKLAFKLNANNFEVKVINESYTSKVSFLDNEEITKQDSYLGKRIYRGLFKTKNNLLINADVNASYNILAKSNPNEKILFSLRDRGLTIPYRVQVNL